MSWNAEWSKRIAESDVYINIYCIGTCGNDVPVVSGSTVELG